MYTLLDTLQKKTCRVVELPGPVKKPLDGMSIWLSVKSDGLAHSAAALSLGIVLHHSDSVHWPTAVV